MNELSIAGKKITSISILYASKNFIVQNLKYLKDISLKKHEHLKHIRILVMSIFLKICDFSVQLVLLSLFKLSFIALLCNSEDLQDGGKFCYKSQSSHTIWALNGSFMEQK